MVDPAPGFATRLGAPFELSGWNTGVRREISRDGRRGAAAIALTYYLHTESTAFASEFGSNLGGPHGPAARGPGWRAAESDAGWDLRFPRPPPY